MRKFSKISLRRIIPCLRGFDFAAKWKCSKVNEIVVESDLGMENYSLPRFYSINAYVSSGVIRLEFAISGILNLLRWTKIAISIIQGVLILMIALSRIIWSQAKNIAIHPDMLGAMRLPGESFARSIERACSVIPCRAPIELREVFVAMGAHLRNLALRQRDYAIGLILRLNYRFASHAILDHDSTSNGIAAFGRISILSLLALLPVGAFAQTGAIQGYCNLGGTTASLSGMQSVNTLQGIIPSCTVTVYLTGTSTKATLYRDASNTPLGNPFTANALGSVNAGAWLFFAATANGYDINLSGGISPLTYTTPVTLTDVYPNNSFSPLPPLNCTGTGSSQVCTFSGTVAAGTSISAPAITASTINICSGTSGNGAAYVCNTSPTVRVQTGTIISFVADTASHANATLTANGGSPVPIYLTPSIPIAAFTFHSGDVVPLQFYLQGGTTPMWLVIGGYSVTGYLPLSGGTLTGALNGTSASFSGTVQAQTDLSVGGSQVLTGVHGTSGAKVQASDGTGTAGDCVKYASDGSVTDAGAPCGTVTSTNCVSSASPAVCGYAAAGSVLIPTGTTSETLTVNTTAVTANSQIVFYPDDTLGTRLGTTCNSTLATLVGGSFISARTPGTSFTITFNGTILTNGVCGSYTIIN